MEMVEGREVGGGKKRRRRSKELAAPASKGANFTSSSSTSWKDPSSEDFRDWASLPREILDLVLRRLRLPDAIRSSAACKQWRVIAAASRDPETPWVLNQLSKKFYSPSEDKVYNLHLPEDVRKGFCVGVYEDWLIMRYCELVEDHNQCHSKFFVYNPFLVTRIELPNFGPKLNQRIFLSSHPENPNCVAVGFHATSIGLCRLAGDASKWTILPTKKAYADMVFSNQSIYVVTGAGELDLIEISSSPDTPFRVCNVLPPPPVDATPQEGIAIYRLMECGREIMMVRFMRLQSLHLLTNAVFRANLRIRKWEAVESLGNRASFLTYFCSTSMWSDKLLGVDDDCIYAPLHPNGLSKLWLGKKVTSNKLLCSFDLPKYWLTPKPW